MNQEKQKIIEETAKSLYAQFQRAPTYQELRKALGDTGSFKTISKHYSSLRKQLIADAAAVGGTPVEVPAPDELIESICASVRATWSIYAGQSERDKHKFYEDSLKTLKGKTAVIFAEIADRDDAISFLENELGLMEQSHKQLREELADKERKVDSFSMELAAEKARYDLVITDRTCLQASLKTLQEEFTAARERIASLEGEVKLLSQSQQKLLQDYNKTSDCNAKMTDELQKTSSTLAEARGKIEHLEEKLEEARKQICAERERADSKERETADIKAELKVTNREVVKLLTELPSEKHKSRSVKVNRCRAVRSRKSTQLKKRPFPR
ncbi:MAG: DNA-binding protein [Geobacteraceae bacterium]